MKEHDDTDTCAHADTRSRQHAGIGEGGGEHMKGHITNLHPTLTALLIELERRMGFELNINSGYRDPGHNVDVGGVENSEHTYDPAEGADVLCLRSVTRYKMLTELFDLGVRRIGIGQTFVHVGIATDKPQDVCWHYYPSAKPTTSEEV